MYPKFTQEALAVVVVLAPLVLVVGLAVTHRIRTTMEHQFRCLEDVLRTERQKHLEQLRLQTRHVVQEAEHRQEVLDEVMRKGGHVH